MIKIYGLYCLAVVSAAKMVMMIIFLRRLLTPSSCMLSSHARLRYVMGSHACMSL